MGKSSLPKHLSCSTGPHVPGCVDVMTEYSKDGLFARIYYPTSLKEIYKHSSAWPSWLPHEHYIIGFAYILNLWTFLIRLLMRYVAGDIKIPAVEKGPVESDIGKLKTVVFSHGMGGTRFFYTCICCELASHGYVVIALEHRDDTPSMTYYYKSEEDRDKNEPTWVKFRRINVGSPSHLHERKEQVEKRASECKRALKLLEDLDAGEDIGNILKSDFDFFQFKDLLDFSKPIMMGHSFGGATALLTLGTEAKFKVGVILDPWMFPIKSHSDLCETVTQPLIVINTQTFHTTANLKELEKYTNRENRETFTIKSTTHENQSDTVHVIGYWLNMFMKKINKILGTRINNSLILRFLRKEVGFKHPVDVDEFLNKYSFCVVEGPSIEGVVNKPKKIPKIWCGGVNELRWLPHESGMPALERSSNGAMALHYAAARGCLDCVKLLVETSDLGANTQMDNDVTPVYLAAQEGHLEVLKYLVLEAGGSLYVRAKDGMAPVHAAAQMGCLTCLKWMVQDQGVDPNLRDVDGATPLHFAASRGHVDTVRWLLRHGGRLTLDKYGKSPINDAAENEQMECLNILVQHGTIPDYHDDNGKLIGCTCRKGDPHQKCSYSDCVNFSSPRAPFYLHGPTRSDCHPTHGGLYVNPMTHQHEGGHNRTESFFLHDPQDVSYNRVKDLFEESVKIETPPENGVVVKVEVHSSSSGAGSEENMSTSDMSERSEEQEHDYEDIYHLRETNVDAKSAIRSRSRDSGSHSRSGSISSTNSGGVVVKLMAQDQPSITPSTESGVSSGSPSDVGHSEEENEKTKVLPPRLPPQQQTSYGNRQLKRVVSEPASCPPPPPPLPTAEDASDKCNTLPARSSTLESVNGEGKGKSADGSSKAHGDGGAKQIVGSGEEIADCDGGSSAVPSLVNRQLVLPSFIPPRFASNGENCLIKPSEYLKSIGGGGIRSVSFSGSASNGPVQEKQSNRCGEKESNREEPGENLSNGPPPPPLPCPQEKESATAMTKKTEPETESSKVKKTQQPLSAISIHDLHSVQLKRTVLHKTMSNPSAANEPFQAQKQDLIAELKLSKDMEGVRKMKVERLKSEEKQEKELVSEITKQFTANNLLKKIPEKDSTGNPIPPWKRQMLAKKAAEKARKDLEEQMKREAEEKRMQSIPAWKRQLLAKKEENEFRSVVYVPKVVEEKKPPPVLVKVNDKDLPLNAIPEENNKENSKPEIKESEGEVEEDAPIIPWRAQLRKTNSKLNLLD